MRNLNSVSNERCQGRDDPVIHAYVTIPIEDSELSLTTKPELLLEFIAEIIWGKTIYD